MTLEQLVHVYRTLAGQNATNNVTVDANAMQTQTYNMVTINGQTVLQATALPQQILAGGQMVPVAIQQPQQVQQVGNKA